MKLEIRIILIFEFRSIQITKEVQTWIKRKQKSRVEDVSQVALNREIEQMIAGCDKEYQEMY